jgi:biopolymer transport protein ExbB/TolQ
MNSSVLLSILGCGGVAILTLIIQKLFSGDTSFLDKFLKDKVKQKAEDNISEKAYIDLKEKEEEIKIKEEQVKQKKQQINNIIEKESEKIEKSKKETNISKITNEINNNWDQL